ncbi:MAG: hypothetical protein ABI131_05980 [Nostocoides sp.]
METPWTAYARPTITGEVQLHVRAEIGLGMGISQMQVSRLLVGILAHLRARLRDPDRAPRRAS